jgi:peptidoglycan/LPS O-acetylase OafA/YrhL
MCLPNSPPPWLAAGRIPGLDGLRAVAVGFVLLAHASQTHGFPGPHCRVAAIGVDVFFVLSGFLITTLLVRERDRTGRVSLTGFYGRRAIRILPAFVAFLSALGIMASAGWVAVAPADWLAAGTFTMNFRPHPSWAVAHLWSLSIEEHFYLAWPLTFAVLSPRTAGRLLVGLLIAAPAARWVILFVRPDLAPLTDLWTPTRLDGIAAGCLLALVARTPAGLQWLDALARRWPLAFAAVGLAVAGRLSGKLSVGVSPSVIALGLAVLVWAAARRAPWWLELTPVVWVGALSYSLYLWQQPFLMPDGEHWWQTLPVNLGFAVATAAGCHYLIERPFLRLRSGRG